MSSTARAQALLALFASAECAEAIAGDLTEGRGIRGPLWFWRQVLATTAALWRETFTRAPLASALLAAGGGWLFASAAFTGIAAVAIFPQAIGSARSWIVLSSLWWGGALCAGATLAGVAQARGMAACAAIAAASEVLLLAFVLLVSPADVLGAPSVVFVSIAGLAPLSLLAGGAIVRHRAIARGQMADDHDAPSGARG